MEDKTRSSSQASSDKLVKQAAGASVNQIIPKYGEDFFRNKESEVLPGLSFISRLVVATGGGAVIEEKNWNYMKRGITVWLDVPLETFARRITAALNDLLKISKDRVGKYENANATVCLEPIASKVDLGDISDLTPTAILIEALVQMGNF